MNFIILFFKKIFFFPSSLYYYIYDKLIFLYFRKFKLFPGWGIHLFCGEFGQGKTSTAVVKAYKLAKKYPQLTILTNISLTNFPKHTSILKLNSPEDILYAPTNTLVLIDEIGTIFNCRDYSSSKVSVPKPVYQHICQCRKRKIMIYGTLPRFVNLDKQLRDIAATVTECSASLHYPFSRIISSVTYSIKEYEAFVNNRLYRPLPSSTYVFIQSDFYRRLYNTDELVDDLLHKDYISNSEILQNQGVIPDLSGDGTKQALKAYKRSVRHRR